ncbi:hypothetical protein T492DRAFT_895286 [Pavlovales sp. CCMP2436]|nr:hypothetical protein T492DRAFT_895286 [Pavlovales sp. CCMP2436]
MAPDRKRAQARIDIVVELRQACAEIGAEWEEPLTASAGDAFASWRTRNKARYKSRKESNAAALARNETDAALQVRLERHARAQVRIDIVDELRQACAETGAEWEEPPTASAGDAFAIWRTRNRARAVVLAFLADVLKLAALHLSRLVHARLVLKRLIFKRLKLV